MWSTMDLGNRGVFMELGKSETDWESTRALRCTNWSEFREKTKNKEEKKM